PREPLDLADRPELPRGLTPAGHHLGVHLFSTPAPYGRALTSPVRRACLPDPTIAYPTAYPQVRSREPDSGGQSTHGSRRWGWCLWGWKYDCSCGRTRRPT